MKQRIPQLDAVRGIAILIVMVHNSVQNLPSLPLQSVWRFGWMGVDLFFVLSGFLITGILFDTKQSDSYFKNFYARRCLRIWPLYYALLILMFVVLPTMRPSTRSLLIARSSPWWAYLFFLQNLVVHHPTGALGPLGVTWSVAIEEQFYVVWAVVVRLCTYAQLRWIAIFVIFLSPVLRVCLLSYHVDLYSNTFCRLDGLMAGAFLALTVRSPAFFPSRYLRVAWLALLVSAPLALITETLQERWITFSFSALASAAFVYLALFAPQLWLQVLMRNRVLTYTGVISYGLYLLHKLPFDIEGAFNLNRHPVPALLAALVVSYAIASASWFLFEKPFLKLKRFFASPPARRPGADGQFAPVTS